MIGRSHTYEELQQLRSSIPGGVGQVVRWNFWDRIATAAATLMVSPFNFFQTAQGSGGKTPLDTNFHGPASLPTGNWFEVQSIGIHISLSVVSSDVTLAVVGLTAPQYINDVLNYGYFEFLVGGKPQLEVGPLLKLGGGCGVTLAGWGGSAQTIAGSAGGGFSLYANGAPNPMGMFDLGDQAIVLEPGQNFIGRTTWPAPPTTPAGTIAHVWMFLDGYLHRPA